MNDVSSSGPGSDAAAPTLAGGIDIIRDQLRTCPTAPGVYRMMNGRGDVLYVGKAKSLRKRVTSYTNPVRQSTRILRMVAETASMEFVTTHTEAEALLLEANLIKRYAPRYNILLRDDKSFPAILLTADHQFPQVLKHRGARARKGSYFGPFASAWAVNQTLTVLQRAFLLRSCTDAVFASRTRPCLLHQIKRCSAPCVGRIGQEEYATLVQQARAFLSGDSQSVQQALAARMQEASDNLAFERAAQYRDRIRALTSVQAHQDIHLEGIDSVDVISAHQAGGQTCIEVFFYRGGRNYGNRAYFPAHAREDDAPEVLEAFVGQFYDNKEPPREVLTSHVLPNAALLAEALGVRAGRKVVVAAPRRGDKRKLVDLALANAREALGRRLAESGSQRRLLEELARVLDLDAAPNRIEVYDNSHISGSQAVGGMIVVGAEGFDRGAYRKFNIRGGLAKAAAVAAPPPVPQEPALPATGFAEAAAATELAANDVAADEGMAPGDDYAMMREVLTRRFARALKEDPDRQRGQWPDVVLVDGGAGQLGIANAVFAELGIDDVAVVAIAKGPDRNAGRERLFLPGRPPFSLEPRDPVLYFLQRMRDEAHRFAIGTHRARRSGAVSHSALDDIPGIGARRKKALLHHFGSARAVAQAGRADLAAVEGINRTMADKIYDWYHPEG